MRLLAIFVVAPALAFVIMCALMLFGVSPHLVFLPGFFLKSRFHVPNVIGVLASGIAWWLTVVAVWLAIHFALRGRQQLK